MHIAIEGMDGVGKTTVSKILAKKLNFKFIEKPLHYLFDENEEFTNYIRIRDYINEQVENEALRAWFYGLGNIFLLHKFQNENIITDRHFLSNYYWCGGSKTEPIFEYMIELIGKPDHTFLLYASIEEAKRRIKNRDPMDPDLKKVKLYEESKLKMQSFLQKYKMNYTLIDTTNLSVEKVVELILKNIPNEKQE